MWRCKYWPWARAIRCEPAEFEISIKRRDPCQSLPLPFPLTAPTLYRCTTAIMEHNHTRARKSVSASNHAGTLKDESCKFRGS